jgi:1,4-dihydroxy-2-naphthoyl-CoA hydrolase
MVTYQAQIKLHQTDAAGVLFFASQLEIAHDAYEKFLAEIKFPIHYFIHSSDYFLPIVHAESDYYIPMSVGDLITVYVGAEKIGDTSFTLAYDFVGSNRQKLGQVRTVHVCVDRQSKQKRAIPEDLRAGLEKYTYLAR